MKAITIKFVSPTNTKGARYSVSAPGWPRKLYDREGGGDAEIWDVVRRYLLDINKKGVRVHDNARIALAGLNEKEDVAALFFEGEDKRLGELLGGVTRLHANPAARKKKTTMRKKTAAKKKSTVRKKIAVTAKSRATGKPPSARLKKRRARNTVPGAYPNPKARQVASKIYAIANYGGEPRIYVFDGAKFVPSWAEGKAYRTKAAASKVMHEIYPKLARSIEKVGVFPGYLSDSTIYRELTGKYRGMGK